MISNIWSRVAEDFSPFRVDVTTERPVAFTSHTVHVLITESRGMLGNPLPASGGGGVAFVDVFGDVDYVKFVSIFSVFSLSHGCVDARIRKRALLTVQAVLARIRLLRQSGSVRRGLHRRGSVARDRTQPRYSHFYYNN
jgi:hypothetical protein